MEDLQKERGRGCAMPVIMIVHFGITKLLQQPFLSRINSTHSAVRGAPVASVYSLRKHGFG